MANPDPETPQYFPHIAQLVTWLVIIVGWYFVDRRQNARETRKEIKAEIDILVETIESAIDSATAYHTATKHDPALSSSVKLLLAKVSKTLNLLREREVCLKNSFMVELRQACTLNNFDTVRFTQKSHTDPIIKEIVEAGQDLIYALRRTFISKYPC